MNSFENKKQVNILKAIGILLFLTVFSYHSYQDAMNNRMLEKSLNDNAAPPQRDFSQESSRQGLSVSQKNTSFKEMKKGIYNATPNSTNEYDTFNEHLDEYLEDPEDEITYSPEIYDALTDAEEEELITQEFDY